MSKVKDLKTELEEAEWVISKLANVLENMPTCMQDFFSDEDWRRIAPWAGYEYEEDEDEE